MVERSRRLPDGSAVVWTLCQCVVVKRELSSKARLSVYQSIFVPTLTYGHELWVVTERMRFKWLK